MCIAWLRIHHKLGHERQINPLIYKRITSTTNKQRSRRGLESQIRAQQSQKAKLVLAAMKEKSEQQVQARR